MSPGERVSGLYAEGRWFVPGRLEKDYGAQRRNSKKAATENAAFGAWKAIEQETGAMALAPISVKMVDPMFTRLLLELWVI